MAAASVETVDTSDRDLGEAGLLIPDGVEAPAELLGDEMLSRASLFGPAASEYVLDLMRADPRALIQAKGCQALSQISESPEGRTAVLSKCGVEVVVEAMMSAMPDEIELQARGCSALANLVMNASEEEEARVLKSGLAAVLGASKAHPAESTVQLKVCLALGNMAFGSKGEATCLSQGALEAVVEAMKAHPGDEALQVEGCDALVNIADSTDGKTKLVALGGLAVAAAAKKHPKCAETAGALADSLLAVAKASQ